MRGRKQTGFTIVELLIVIVVITILAAITIVAYNGVQLKTRQAAVAADERALKNSMLAYKAQMGELPPTGDSWNYNTTPPDCTRWPPVLTPIASVDAGTKLPTVDPWGNCYGYDDNDCNSGSAANSPTYIKSLGPDGVVSSDDIIITVTPGC